MYPLIGGAGAAGAVVGLVAGLVTHGLLVDVIHRKQESAARAASDKVLEPYRELIERLTHQDLFSRALNQLSPDGSRHLLPDGIIDGSKWLVESAPLFLVPGDQRALILDNVVTMSKPDGTVAYQSPIRVVSTAREAADMVAHWTAAEGEKLREAVAGMLAESIAIALAQADGVSVSESNSPQRSFRYRLGGERKLERGSLIQERCDRIVVRTLRGGLLSIPLELSAAAHPPNTESCKGRLAGL